MGGGRGHPQRFPEATIWLACLAALAAALTDGIVWLRGGQLAGLLYPHVHVSDALWPLTVAWMAAAVLAVLCVAFLVGHSLRLAATLAIAAFFLGLLGVSLVGRWVDFSAYGGHLLFGDPTRKWQFLLLWTLPGLLLIATAVLAVIDSVTGVRRRPPDAGTHDPRTPTAGNEALHWHGSTYAGIDAQSNARERY